MGSVFKGALTLSLFGQSHGAAIGMTLDGLPAGEKIDMQALRQFLQRRAPGKNAWSTKRAEPDEPDILSGIVNDTTCGAPICAVIHNKNTRSADYDNIKLVPRPGHADYTAQVKYGGFQDVAGGGHFSGRVTAALCIAGGICKQILAARGITVNAHIQSIAGIDDDSFNPLGEPSSVFKILEHSDFAVLNGEKGELMKQAIVSALNDGDSVGGAVECIVQGLPVGLGEPMFDGMEGNIAKAVFAVPAVKGVEFGAGFEVAAMRGSQNNDAFVIKDGAITTETNNHGGILGGITTGMPLLLKAAIKPTPSISKEQRSVDLTAHKEGTLNIKGRHDPCIVPRAVPCIEAAVAVAILDSLLVFKGVN